MGLSFNLVLLTRSRARSELKLDNFTTMLLPTLLVTISLVTTMKAEQLDCPFEDMDQIRGCVRGSEVTGNPYACEAVEAVFYNCIESFNANCGHLIPVVKPFLDVSQTEIRSNAPCYHQKFDQYFNQDGQCSFEDVRQLYKLVVKSLPRPHPGNAYICEIFQILEPVIKQHKESCMGLFQSQTSKLAKYSQAWANRDYRFQMPECLKVYLPKEDE